jgi:hypothetical protein
MSEPLSFVLFLLVPLAFGGLLRLFFRRPRGSRDSWPRLIAGNLLVFLFLLSLLFVAGETYYRFVCDASDAVNYTKVSARWFQRYWIRNAIGFRDNLEYSLAIQPGKRRVSFVGDSFTAGHGIKSVEDRFANRIRAAHPGWEIHVLALLGADTEEENGLLEKCLREGYQLDQVVLVYCLNDVADLLPEWKDMMKSVRTDFRSKNWFVQHSYLVNTLYYRWISTHDPQLRNYFRFVRDGLFASGAGDANCPLRNASIFSAARALANSLGCGSCRLTMIFSGGRFEKADSKSRCGTLDSFQNRSSASCAAWKS